MTERQIANRIKKLEELEAQLDTITAQIDALKGEIKAEMAEREELTACGYVVHYTHVITNKLDTTRIKKELPDLYSKYIKQVFSRRFSISTL